MPSGMYHIPMGKKKGDKKNDGKRHLPASRGDGPRDLTKLEENVCFMLIEGHSVADIAKAQYPGEDEVSKRKRKNMRGYIRRLAHDVVFQDAMGAAAKVESILGLGPAAHALNKKAAAGRVDAIKLLFESSGYYNPRVQHEHGGEIKITIRNAPRPERADEAYLGVNHAGDEIVDATVVEDA